MIRAAVAIALVAACSSRSAPSAPPAPPSPDAGVARVAAPPTPDDDVRMPSTAREPTHPGRPIEITLRSTPAHSLVAVDGRQLGTTPQVWEGTTGAQHEFSFVLKDHQVARYRFVPVASGVVYARLERIVDETPAATGMPPELARPEPPPPPTVLAPEPPVIDAAVPVVPTNPTGPGPQP